MPAGARRYLAAGPACAANDRLRARRKLAMVAEGDQLITHCDLEKKCSDVN
ncbi:hypothetical protein SBD_3986 [Streptomyces bottropensis ATCC 25435]|uniref:Uncharacterized protein n=1 Tax=Streptomyces bottropensis ATCC 25435 TaxID=1054862 RepID=M3EYK8_9ACTN|nr:hypothetical protein SBD_3986 [Streptomyces bottropensis ATCC 25435]